MIELLRWFYYSVIDLCLVSESVVMKSMVGKVPLCSLIQMSLFLPFQNGENAIFRAETVAQRNGPIFAKWAQR